MNKVAGRELDALVAEKVMGWTVHWASPPELCPPGASYWRDGRQVVFALPYYSIDIAAAWKVVEGLPSAFWPEVGRMDDGRWYCEIVGRGDTPADVSPGPIARVVAHTAPHAICLAALHAVAVVSGLPA